MREGKVSSLPKKGILQRLDPQKSELDKRSIVVCNSGRDNHKGKEQIREAVYVNSTVK